MTPSTEVSFDSFVRRGRAAEELWLKDFPTESTLLRHEALVEILGQLKASAPTHPLVAEIEVLLAEFAALPNTPHHTRDHAAWLERARGLSSRLVREFCARPRPSRRRLVEIAGGLLVLSLAVGVWIRREGRPHATASAEYSKDFPAFHAVDGLSATEWLLPDGRLGFLDVVLSGKRTVERVVITNVHNRQYMDRAIRRARVTVFDGDQARGSAEVTFPKIDASAAKADALFAGSRGNRVRIELLEVFGKGGGVAEVEVD